MRTQRIAILGGTGKMGQWFSKYFNQRGFTVTIAGRNPAKTFRMAAKLEVEAANTYRDAVSKADYIMVSTSISSTSRTIRHVMKYVSDGSALFDVASVKGDIIDALKDAAKLGVRTFSIHPMFGPGAESLANRRIVVIPVSGPDAYAPIINIFKHDGAKVFILKSGDEHDTLMAFSLCLPHFLNIVFGDVAGSADIRTLKKVTGTTFALQQTISNSVLSEDPKLYAEIQLDNKHFKSLLKKTTESFQELAKSVLTNDGEAFKQFFERAKKKALKDPEFATAYERFSKVAAIV